MEHRKTLNRQPAQMPRPHRPHGIIHKVAPGETMYTISRKYHIPLTELMYANPYVDVYNLIPGDEIRVPVSPDRGSPTPDSGIPQGTPIQ